MPTLSQSLTSGKCHGVERFLIKGQHRLRKPSFDSVKKFSQAVHPAKWLWTLPACLKDFAEHFK